MDIQSSPFFTAYCQDMLEGEWEFGDGYTGQLVLQCVQSRYAGGVNGNKGMDIQASLFFNVYYRDMGSV